MAVTYSLLDLTTQLRAIGRGVVFYADKWDGATNLSLTHLGDTEGEISVATNEEYTHLILPELTGQAKHASYVSGEDPVITIPLFLADPALRAIVSPTGNASGGYQRRRPVKELTLVIFPEELFFDAANDTYASLTFDGTAWKVGSTALTTKQQELLGLSMWFWRGYFAKPNAVFRHEDGGKVVAEVTFQVMQSDLPIARIPDGNRLYTLGDPADAGIDIHPLP
ncbi:MAG TPA: hypothetical protein VIL46_10350 [Gemmataceae bacterium]